MSKENLVSIITPLYNAECFIEETIESVLAQTYKNYEMVIIDDCSEDNGPKIVKEYSRQDNRIRLISSKKNIGGAAARNMAIKKARGKYLAFLDSDDLWHPKKLEKQVEFMEKNDYEFTYTWYQRITEEGELIDGIIRSKERVAYSDLLKSNHIGCLTAVYNQEKLGKIYMPLIKKRQDYALWLQVLKKTEFAYCFNENLAKYRIVRGSLSRNKVKLVKYNWELFRKVEEFSLMKSICYLTYNICHKVFKNHRKQRKK